MTTRRKLLLAGAGCALVAPPFAARAQARKAPIVIGCLGTDSSSAPDLLVFKAALAALGRREGTDFVVDAHLVYGTPEQLRLSAEQLAARKPAVILSWPRSATHAAAKAAPGIPVVQVTGGSLVEAGLATSLARPGGMVTGLTNLNVQRVEKQTELLAGVIPKLQRVGYLIDGTFRKPDELKLKETATRAATRYKAEAIFADASEVDDLESAFAQFRKSEVQGVILLPYNWFVSESRRIIQIALNHRLPVIAAAAAFVEAGALIAYNADRAYSFRRAAWYVDQILQGRKPGDLPIEQPMKFELVINMKTAKALGITIPRWILLQADRVIG